MRKGATEKEGGERKGARFLADTEKSGCVGGGGSVRGRVVSWERRGGEGKRKEERRKLRTCSG